MNVWNVIYVSSRQEKKIQARLTEMGVETYVPLKKVLRQWSDRKKWVTIPLITGYVFVQATELKKEVILQTSGVVSFVRFNGKIAAVKQAEIDTLKSIEKFGYEIDVATDDVNTGDELMIFQGPLKGLLVKVVEVTNDNSICVFLLKNVGHSFKIKLPRAILKKIEEYDRYC
ncbi:MAG: UpxY family transcription antiterminator [Bacteroidia bacterium]